MIGKITMSLDFFKTGRFLAKTAALTLILGAAPALAQIGGNSDAPLDVDADDMQFVGSTLTLIGQVDARQGDARLLADRVEILGVQGSNIDGLERIVANGNFYYITPKQEVRGNRGVYEKSTETFTVTGNVILLQGEDNIVTGDTLYYNTMDQSARIVGSCQGRKCGSNGRVKALLKSSNASSGPS